MRPRNAPRNALPSGIGWSGFHPARSVTVTLVPLLELNRGQWRAAVDQLVAAAAEEPEPHYRLFPELEVAVALSRLDPRGGMDEVRSMVASALADAETAGCRRCATDTACRGAEALARVGDLAVARSLLEDWHRAGGGYGQPPLLPTGLGGVAHRVWG